MSRNTLKTVRCALNSKTIQTSSVSNSKTAQLGILQDYAQRTDDPLAVKVLVQVKRCDQTYGRCNSPYCPTCANPKRSKSKRRLARQDDNDKSIVRMTTSSRSNEYRVRGGQNITAPFEGLPLCTCHCITVNLGMVPLSGDLTSIKHNYHVQLRKALDGLTDGAITRGKFDFALKYLDDVQGMFPDDVLPDGVTNANLPHTRMAMLHAHFIVFDPWLTRLEIRNLLTSAFDGKNRVCVKRPKPHMILQDGTVVAGLQGFAEYMCMEKVEVAFGDESADAFLEFFKLNATWNRKQRNFSSGKSIDQSGVVIDQGRVAFLLRDHRRAWINKNWSKLGHGERFLRLWLSGGSDFANIKSTTVRSPSSCIALFRWYFLHYSNWVRRGIFETLDFYDYAKEQPPDLA